MAGTRPVAKSWDSCSWRLPICKDLPSKKQVCLICYANEASTVLIPTPTVFNDKEVKPFGQAHVTLRKVSGTQARSIQNTTKLIYRLNIVFQQRISIKLLNIYQKSEFYQMRLHESFPHICGSPHLIFFIFWSLDGRFNIAWLNYSPRYTSKQSTKNKGNLVFQTKTKTR